jgi:hypothetical protein
VTYALQRRMAELEKEACWPGLKRSWPFGDLPRDLILVPTTTEADLLWRNGQYSRLASHCFTYLVSRVALDLPCQYGMNKTRPIWIGLTVWFICSFIYLIFVHRPGDSGIYIAYAQGILLDPDAMKTVLQVAPEPVHLTGIRGCVGWIKRELQLLRVTMFFSLMNAFNLGFKEVDFGRWLRMLSRREFDLKAKGWVRTVAGIQALLSLYLLALWFLTTFGKLLD